MFFDAIAVLVITFFAAVGMAEVSEWLLKRPFKKRKKYKIFAVAKIDSVSEDEIEPMLWSMLAETNGKNRKILFDCEGISDKKLFICQKLAERFDCYLFRGESELFSMIGEGLHGEEKKL